MENCKKCKCELKDGYNFCPKCGEPLTTIAESIKKEERRGAMLEIIGVLASNLKDPDSLNVVEELLQKVKNK